MKFGSPSFSGGGTRRKLPHAARATPPERCRARSGARADGGPAGATATERGGPGFEQAPGAGAGLYRGENLGQRLIRRRHG